MAHERIRFAMPAPCDVVFDVFHYHAWRRRWDSLVSRTEVEGGAPCPYVGAVTGHDGKGMLRSLSMRTKFISYDRPRLAAACMIGASFPFTRWAASMKHEPAGAGQSVMIYTYSIETGPPALRWLMEPVVNWVFRRQTMKRFKRMQDFLSVHTAEVQAWQHLQMKEE